MRHMRAGLGRSEPKKSSMKSRKASTRSRRDSLASLPSRSERPKFFNGPFNQWDPGPENGLLYLIVHDACRQHVALRLAQNVLRLSIADFEIVIQAESELHQTVIEEREIWRTTELAMLIRSPMCSHRGALDWSKSTFSAWSKQFLP